MRQDCEEGDLPPGPGEGGDQQGRRAVQAAAEEGETENKNKPVRPASLLTHQTISLLIRLQVCVEKEFKVPTVKCGEPEAAAEE